jgi:2-polyprenyl-3-methyl-5-hydroxy-6-metoxy-1,4-benzoquinol methylase
MGSCASLLAAERLGVIRALEKGPQSIAELARLCAVTEDGLEILVETLSALDVVELNADRYHLTATVSAMRTGGTQMAALDFEEMWGRYSALDVLLSDEVADLTHPEPRQAYQAGLEEHFASGLATAVAAVDSLRSLGLPFGTVIDLGTGSGVFASAFAMAGAETVVGIDQPTVIEAAARTVAAGVQLVAGDIRDLSAMPKHFDVVIIANVIHLFSRAVVERFIRSAGELLGSDGALMIVEPVADLWEDAAARSQYSLDVFVRTGKGHCYQQRDIIRWLRSAGLSLAQQLRLPDAGEPQWLFVGRRGPTRPSQSV